MTDSRDDRAVTDLPSDESTRVKRDWQAPSLTLLGDANKLTENAFAGAGDGGTGSS